MKILYIASIATKHRHFDGERNKSKSVKDCLVSLGKIKTVNLSIKSLQPFSMLRFVALVCFWRPNYVFISKAPSGGSLILSILQDIHFNMKKTIFYSFGRGLYNFGEKINPQVLSKVGTLICETPEVASDFLAVGCKRVLPYPCIKKYYQIPQPSIFCQKKILNLIFWARVTEDKGVFDAIDSVIRLNKIEKRFTLSIAGGEASTETIRKIKGICKNYPDIIYYGTSFTITGVNTYYRLSKYDLNIFPTHFYHECVPGSVVDNLIAGVPTLSTKFNSYEDMLKPSFAYFLDDTKVETIDRALSDIYNNQKELFQKRNPATIFAKQYSYDAFLDFLKKNVLN
jgi:glycosyltransferase involved in cell wall biosynthesis